MSRNPHFPLPDNMPPLPKAGEYGSQVCSAVRFYLAILDDLPPEQVQILLAHARTCADCAAMQRLMQRTTAMVASLSETVPSKRVDQAVMAAIAAHAAAQPQSEHEGR